MKRFLASLGMVILVLGSAPLMGASKARNPQKAAISVNINKAPASELVKLPGIGPKKAERIVTTRKRIGGFKRVEDIMKVKGIGEKTFKRIRSMIRVK